MVMDVINNCLSDNDSGDMIMMVKHKTYCSYTVDVIRVSITGNDIMWISFGFIYPRMILSVLHVGLYTQG